MREHSMVKVIIERARKGSGLKMADEDNIDWSSNKKVIDSGLKL